MTDIASVIEKVQKLRRLARSDNANEAAAAAAAADRIIQEHALTEASLEAEGASPGELPTEADEPLAIFHERMPQWKVRLALRLAHHYGVALYVNGWRRPGGREEHVQMIGRPSDVEILRYMFAWLSLEIERLSLAHKGTAARNSFRHGAILGIGIAMEESKRAARAQSTSTALAVVDQRLAQATAVKDAMSFDGKKRLGGSVRDHGAYEAGQRTGQRLMQQAKTPNLPATTKENAR